MLCCSSLNLQSVEGVLVRVSYLYSYKAAVWLRVSIVLDSALLNIDIGRTLRVAVSGCKYLFYWRLSLGKLSELSI